MDNTKIQFSNKQTDILNRLVLGVINTTLVLFFVYTLVTKQYLPDSGTGVVMAIISSLAIVYVAVNMFVGGLNIKNMKNMAKTLTMRNIANDRDVALSKAKKEYFIFRMINSAKLFYISIITIALSVLFFKYNNLIQEHHSTIPNFDLFFGLIVFSLLSQTIYATSVHFTYIKELIDKYLSVSYRSLLLFAILNFLNFLFIVAMYSELQFMPTDG